MHSDHEELLHVILKGLPKEYAPFASTIRTRDGVLPLEKLSILLQTEEQFLNETSDSLSNSALAMFVSRTNLQMVSMAIRVTIEEEARTIILEAEEAGPQTSITTPALLHLILHNHSNHKFHSLPLKAELKDQPVRSAGRSGIMQLTVTIGWILLIKEKILLPSLQPWQVHLMQ